jgi:hypothetical protein
MAAAVVHTVNELSNGGELKGAFEQGNCRALLQIPIMGREFATFKRVSSAQAPFTLS